MVSFSQLDSVLEATANLERCARFLDLEDWIVLRLRNCEQEITLNAISGPRPLPVLWVRHSSALGPAAISLQASRDATIASERVRAMQSTWISALYNLNLGGGAATIVLDAEELGEQELHAAFHATGTAISEIAGNALLIPNNLNVAEMTWLADSSGCANIAGKLRDSSAEHLAYGYLELIRCAAGRLHDIRVAVQGFGPVMQSLVHDLHRAGARVVAIADESGGLRDPLGFDPSALVAHNHDAGMLLGYPGAEATLNSAVLETDCDVLVLAASPQQVTMSNAPNIRAKVLLEITPQAIASEARALLPDTGMIVSDLVCGGIAPLYYATESSRVELATSHRPILRRAIRRTWASVAEAATRWHLPHHAAAEMLAINRVATALRARGH